MSENEKLELTFEPQTIKHLGVQMYSTLPNALAELIANAYDADAENASIILREINSEKSITVYDDGTGMTFSDVNEKFLKIGRNRRTEAGDFSPSGKRRVTGRKGLGKLAFFGIASEISISTAKEGEFTSFSLIWDDLIESKGNYAPIFKRESIDPSVHKTIIVFHKLKRVSPFDSKGLAISLSKLFTLFSRDYKVKIVDTINKLNFNVNQQLCYESLNVQFNWKIPEEITDDKLKHYFSAHSISGNLFTTETPLKPGLRGITLFANGRLANSPEFFGVSESSHAFSYLAGEIASDFIDELSQEGIATNRQSLNWTLPETEELKQVLKSLMHWVEKEWRDKRKSDKMKKLSEKTHINLESWYGSITQKDILDNVNNIITHSADDAQFSDATFNLVVSSLHNLVPNYPYFHWRHLCSDIQSTSKTDYERADYYRAITESIKHYNSKVQQASGNQEDGVSLMQKVFGLDKDIPKCLSVCEPYKRTDKSEFSADTKRNIEDGQRELSAGIVSSFRNPISHEEIKEIQESGLITESDCLDALSLLNYLFSRLSKAKKTTT